MNSSLLIFLAIAATTLIIVLLWRSSKRVVIDPSIAAPVAPVGRAAPIVVNATPAPGVVASTGQVPPNPPPPPPPGISARIRTNLVPSGPLQNVPIVGGTLASVSRSITNLPVNITLRTNAIVTSSLAHIPVVGKALAAPSKVAGKVGSTVGKALSSLF